MAQRPTTSSAGERPMTAVSNQASLPSIPQSSAPTSQFPPYIEEEDGDEEDLLPSRRLPRRIRLPLHWPHRCTSSMSLHRRLRYRLQLLTLERRNAVV